MQYSYRDIFSTAESGFELAGFNALWCFCSFLFHLFHISKTFPSEDFSHQGNKKSFSGPDGVNSEHRARGSCCLWSETAEYSVQSGQAHSHTSPIMKWASVLSLQKTFTEAERNLSQRRQLVH